MERLSAQNEFDIRIFSGILETVVTVEDMFPPDYSGDSEPRNPILPLFPSAVALAVVGVTRHIETQSKSLYLV